MAKLGALMGTGKNPEKAANSSGGGGGSLQWDSLDFNPQPRRGGQLQKLLKTNITAA